MLDRHQPVAALVLDHSACAAVLQRHRIDFCCRGDLSLEAAAAAQGVDLDVLLGELEAAVASRCVADEVDPRTLPTPALLASLVERHHQPLREALPTVRGLAAKVSRVHGERTPALKTLRACVEGLAETLLPHFEEEERAVFPALAAEPPNPAAARMLFDELTREHEEVTSWLLRMRAAADDYAVPSWACTSYRTLFAELRRLEGDVAALVHLEHNVLRPRFAAP